MNDDNNKLKWIEIKNYRGIENLKLENFTDINVFIGKNNTGKSSILEAIYIAGCRFKGDFLSEDPFIRILEKRGYSKDEKIYTFLEEIRYKHRYDSTISSNLYLYPFEIIIYDNYVPSENIKISKKETEDFISIWLDDTKEKKLLDIDDSEATYIIYKDSKSDLKDFIELKPEKCLFVDSNLLKNVYESGPLYYKLIDIHGIRIKKNIISKIEKYYPDVEDIDVKKDIIRIIFKDYAILISSLSDGLRSIILSSFSLFSLDNGIICIEEPENHLHPSLMNLYTKNIVESVKENNNQIFISTHSLEFLDKLLSIAKKLNVDINIYHMLKINNKLDYVIYNRDDSLGAIEDIGIDLREDD